MSAKETTVGELKKMLEAFPDDMRVTSISPNRDDWHVEGTVDGVSVYLAHVWELRTGWRIIDPGDVDPEMDSKAVIIAANGSFSVKMRNRHRDCPVSLKIGP